MNMKIVFCYIISALVFCVVNLTSCNNTEPVDILNGNVCPVPVKIEFDVASMQNKGDFNNSRAILPMTPEEENPMRSVAIVQFDSEGVMQRINSNDANHPYFHYFNLTSDENPIGQTNFELNVELLPLKNTRICVIANLSVERIRSLTYSESNNRQFIWNEFRENTVDIPYILEEINEGKSVGHVEEIYMYGQFEGEINSNGMAVSNSVEKQLSILMARLISRLEMNIICDDGVTIPYGYKIYLGFTGIEKSAYLVPGAANFISELVHNHVMLTPVDRTDIIKENQANNISPFYFYIAPHIVLSDINRVTKFIIWCVPETVSKDNLIINKDTDPTPNPEYNYYPIPMCNDPLQNTPGVEGALWLNRNSLYHVNITLTNRKTYGGRSCFYNGSHYVDIMNLIEK